jgi:hypothetical protein
MLKYSDAKEHYISDLKIVKILSTVPRDKGFYFYTDIGCFTDEFALNLVVFAQKLETVNTDSLKFHFQRNDFQNWIKTTIGDDVLAEQINRISQKLPIDYLRKEIVKTVQIRITQLKLLHSEIIHSK